MFDFCLCIADLFMLDGFLNDHSGIEFTQTTSRQEASSLFQS